MGSSKLGVSTYLVCDCAWVCLILWRVGQFEAFLHHVHCNPSFGNTCLGVDWPWAGFERGGGNLSLDLFCPDRIERGSILSVTRLAIFFEVFTKMHCKTSICPVELVVDRIGS